MISWVYFGLLARLSCSISECSGLLRGKQEASELPGAEAGCLPEP